MKRLHRLAICGPGRCGKDTAARWLASHTPLRLARTTSEIIAPHVADRLGLTVEEAFTRRHENRPLWFGVGNELRSPAPTYLVRECLKEGEIVVGLRNSDEVKAARAEGLVDLFVWIERQVPVDPTQTFRAERCDVTVLKDGTLEDLFRRLEALTRFAGLLS
jgi:hypothetical protein